MKKQWEEVYEEAPFTWYPVEGIIRFVSRYMKKRVGINKFKTKENMSEVLDLGCGNGSHIVFFAEQGFNVSGIDISEQAIEIAKAWTHKHGLKADLRVGDIENLPFGDESFDVIISNGVFDHISFSKAKKCVQEAFRVCKPGGYVYLTLRSTKDCEYGRGEKTDKNTFILSKGYEKGIIQHFFDLQEISDLFKDFKIFDIELYEVRFPRKFGIDKAYLQSSIGLKTYIDISKMSNMDLKYSRWHVAGEKKGDVI